MKHFTAVILAVTALQSGCSALFVNGPDTPPAPPNCTSNNVFPVIDVVGAVIFGVAGAALLAISNDDYVSDSDRTGLEVAGLIYGSAGVGLALSANSGFGKTRRCREARQDYDRAMYRPYYQPQPYQPYPPQPYPQQPYPPQPYPYPQPAPYAPAPYAPAPYAPAPPPN